MYAGIWPASIQLIIVLGETLQYLDAWNTVNEKHSTPDISPLVQEVVDRPGWSIGNSMAFIITGDGERTAEAYDGESGAAPLLHIEYETTPTPPNNPPTTTPIGDYIVFENTVDTEITLTEHFDDAEDGATGLTYTVFANDNPGLVGTSISDGSLTLSYTPDAFGEANITIRATDSGLLTVDDTFNVTVLEVNDPPTSIHVGDLEYDTSGNKNWNGKVWITVHSLVDTIHSIVSGAVVYGTWIESGVETTTNCTTDGSGTCQVNKSTKGNSLAFNVTNIELPDHVYDASNNHDADNDPGSIDNSPANY
ncbi:MAG: hypothetical protein P8X83_08960 [Nitrosopumilaceae archaeon]